MDAVHTARGSALLDERLRVADGSLHGGGGDLWSRTTDGGRSLQAADHGLDLGSELFALLARVRGELGQDAFQDLGLVLGTCLLKDVREDGAGRAWSMRIDVDVEVTEVGVELVV